MGFEALKLGLGWSGCQFLKEDVSLICTVIGLNTYVVILQFLFVTRFSASNLTPLRQTFLVIT